MTCPSNMKTCTRCNEAKERTEFYKDRTKKDGLTSSCKQCARERSRKWREANPEKVVQCNKEWRENNPDLFAAYLGKSTSCQRGAVVSDIYDVHECVPFYAEARRLTRETGVRHEVDHIVPISKGGLHCQTNMQVLTKAENRRKSDDLSD